MWNERLSPWHFNPHLESLAYSERKRIISRIGQLRYCRTSALFSNASSSSNNGRLLPITSDVRMILQPRAYLSKTHKADLCAFSLTKAMHLTEAPGHGELWMGGTRGSQRKETLIILPKRSQAHPYIEKGKKGTYPRGE